MSAEPAPSVYFETVVATTLAANTRSRWVMERLGMRTEKELIYPAEDLPGWTEDQRRGVKYRPAKTECARLRRISG